MHQDAPVKILYFSWIREQIGMGEETVLLPTGLQTVSDLLVWMQSRNEQFATTLQKSEIIRVALDQLHTEHDAPLGNPREIALFPPMTGG